MEKKATLKDIADILGVSTTTVYKALNNKPKVSEAVRREILDVADELNYKPNKIAQALSRNPLKIGAIIPAEPETFYGYIRTGLEKAFKELEDYNVIGEIQCVHDDLEANDVWERFYENRVNGIVTAFNEFNLGCRKIQEKYDFSIPIMCIVSEPTDQTEILGGLYVPHQYMGALAAEILCSSIADKTKPLIACIPDCLTNVHQEGRYHFYRACREFGAENLYTYILHYDFEDQKRVAAMILEKHPDVAGIYVGSNNSCGLCEYLEQNGLSGRVKVVGHDLYPELAEHLKRGSLSAALFQNQHDNARKAVKELVKYLSGEYKGQFTDILFRPEVVFRSNLEMYRDLY